MYCECDYDTPSVYERRPIKAARKVHTCSECGSNIQPGEPYEHTFGIWDGMPDNFKTCSRCLTLRDFVKAHVPCVCWAHGNMIEDCMDAAEGWNHEAPGLWFGAARLLVKIRRAREASRVQSTRSNILQVQP